MYNSVFSSHQHILAELYRRLMAKRQEKAHTTAPATINNPRPSDDVTSDDHDDVEEAGVEEVYLSDGVVDYG